MRHSECSCPKFGIPLPKSLLGEQASAVRRSMMKSLKAPHRTNLGGRCRKGCKLILLLLCRLSYLRGPCLMCLPSSVKPAVSTSASSEPKTGCLYICFGRVQKLFGCGPYRWTMVMLGHKRRGRWFQFPEDPEVSCRTLRGCQLPSRSQRSLRRCQMPNRSQPGRCVVSQA